MTSLVFVCLVFVSASHTHTGTLCGTRLSHDTGDSGQQVTRCNMNKSLDSYQHEQDESRTFGHLLLVVSFAIGLVAVLANVFVIDTLRSRGELASSGDTFVLCLAITDLLTGSILTITVGNIFTVSHTRTACLLQICSMHSTLLCSALILSALTTDRYFKIVHPFKHERYCTDRRPHWVCSSLAVFSCIIGSLPYTGVGYTANANFVMCSYLQVIQAGYQAGLFVLMVAPILFSLLLYFWILRLAMNHAVAIARSTRIVSDTITRIRLRYIRVLFIMAGMYLTLYIPAVVGTVLLRNIPPKFSESTRNSFFHLSSIGMWSNCLINPLIYASKVATVKARLRVLFGWQRQSIDSEMPSRKATSSVSKGLLERAVRYCIKFMSVKISASDTRGVMRQTDDPIPDIEAIDSRMEDSADDGSIGNDGKVKSNGVKQGGNGVEVSGPGSEGSGEGHYGMEGSNVKVIKMEVSSVKVVRMEVSSVKVSKMKDSREDGGLRSQDSTRARSNNSLTNGKQVK